MICEKCGKTIPEESTFCRYCGAAQSARPTSAETAPAVEQQPDFTPPAPSAAEPAKQQVRKRRKGLKVILVVFLAIALLIGGTIGYYALFHPRGQFWIALLNGNYERAQSAYQRGIDRIDDFDEYAEHVAERAISGLKEDLKAGDINTDAALSDLHSIAEIVPGLDVNDDLQWFEDLADSQESYAAGQAYQQQEQYGSAIRSYRSMDSDDPNYAAAQAEIAALTPSYYESVIKNVEELVAEHDYTNAVALLEEAVELLPEHEQLPADLEAYRLEAAQYRKDSALAAAAELAAANDLLAAYQLTSELVAEQPNDPDISAKQKSYQQQYETAVLTEAKALADADDYEGAIGLLNIALKALPGNEKLTATAEDYKTYLPVPLASLDYFVGKAWATINTDTDNLGNSYQESITDTWGGQNSTYKINGQYSKLTGVFYQRYEHRSNSDVAVFKVYGDDKLLYSVEMSGGIEPISFSVDLVGVQEMRIETDYWWEYAALGNCNLYK